MHGILRPAIFGLGLTLLAVDIGGARAQRVSGAVLETRTGAPVVAAFVTLLDSDGAARLNGLTGRTGRFSLLAPAPGRYRLRVDRIGYRSTVTDPFDLTAGGATRIDVEVPGEPIDLGTIDVEGRGRCVLRPEEGQPTWELWSEARKALEVTRWTEAGRSLSFRVVYFRRALDPGTRVVETESIDQQLVTSERAFFAEPPEVLARDGYIREEDGRRSFYGPDAVVLLSDAFLDAHCFRRLPETRAGRIGLAFEPLDPRSRRDVRGTLWLDPATAELRSLDFRYVNPDLPGEIEAEIAAVLSPAGERLPFQRRPTVLAGTVINPATGRPLPDAEVILEGTPFTTRTDAAGRFRFGWVSGSRYEVTFAHPTVRRPGSVVVDVVRGDTVRIRLGG